MSEDSLCDNGSEASKENPFADKSKPIDISDYDLPF